MGDMFIEYRPFINLFACPYDVWKGRGDKTRNCRIWLETAASTVLATGLFFAHLALQAGVKKSVEAGLKKMGWSREMDPIIMVADLTSKFIFNNAFMKVDSFATGMCSIAMIHYLMASHFIKKDYRCASFFAVAALGRLHLHSNENEQYYVHSGLLKKQFDRYAEKWSPTVASWFG